MRRESNAGAVVLPHARCAFVRCSRRADAQMRARLPLRSGAAAHLQVRARARVACGARGAISVNAPNALTSGGTERVSACAALTQPAPAARAH
jgi:hypothetical protein